MSERDEGRLLAMVVRASAVAGADGLAELGRLDAWAKLGPGFTTVLRRLQDRGLVDVVSAPRVGVRLTPFGRAFISGQLLGGGPRL
jgi:hypothetical protein